MQYFDHLVEIDIQSFEWPWSFQTWSIVGRIRHIKVNEIPKGFHTSVNGVITKIAVLPYWRHHGYGSDLMRDALKIGNTKIIVHERCKHFQ